MDDIADKKITELPSILSIQEVANFFSMHYLSIYRAIHRGELRAYKDEDGTWCITRSDLRDYCDQHLI